ncbi:MAG TPA: hypothetical protein PLE54_16950 [Burkholderiaceae bacterium]|nr:hypothetical protein [Burkholderiaceae bacterium]
MSPRAIEQRLRRLSQRLSVYVGSAHVAMDLQPRWGGRHLHRWRGALGAAPTFEAAMAVLAAGLNELTAAVADLRGLMCDVVLADRWLLYDVVALDVAQVSRPAVNAAVAATLADIGGTRAQTLDVRWQWQRGGSSVLAIGIERAWLAQLSSVLQNGKLALRSITGEFVAIFNAQRARLGGQRQVFAVQRESDVQWALMSDGAIRMIAFASPCRGPADLARIATHALRAYGEDTAADIEFVVDPGAPDEVYGTPPPGGGHWALIRAPEWAAAL